MRSQALTALIASLTLLVAPAAAEPSPAAQHSYESGDYLSAASSAEAEGSPAALVFAARSLMAACMTTPHRRDVGAWLDRAERASEAALRLDPNSVEARLQLAFTLGAKGRRASLAQAIAYNYAPRGRHLIQEAIARAPDDAEAHALLGAWHLEVLRRGGATGARFYGARLDTGIAEFERALALAPDDELIPIQYGIALLQLDPTRYRDRVLSLLAVPQDAAADAFEAHAFAQARHISDVLSSQGASAAQAAARAAFP